ncbi:MAG: NAD(P)-dependent oxidoreductase [Defluviicoccus sp.]|nr:NAD(P)-dependent oxidoreductase [Defluviicoccus sp.]MDE0278786.1 NAD(P)-dependent oxidoreductase [Defluviicoccus sp.]
MSAAKIESVGVIGLGKMGGPLARHLAEAGFETRGYDVRAEAMAAAGADGAAPAGSPAELASASDLTIVGVGFDSEVEAALFGDGGVLESPRPGSVVAVASTVAPATMLKIAERMDDSGIALLDIPMARGEQAAIDGKLLIFGGGEREVFDRCRPAFSTFSDSIHHLGPVGAGQVGKLVNNLILWACISANEEGFRLAEKLGVEAGPLRDALLRSSAANWALDTQAVERPMPWAEKDMTIVLKEADAARLSLPLCGTIKEVIKGVKIARGQPMPEER